MENHATTEIEPTGIEIEALHLAGQLELQLCMQALAEVIATYPDSVPTQQLLGLQDRYLDRWNDLNVDTSQ